MQNTEFTKITIRVFPNNKEVVIYRNRSRFELDLIDIIKISIYPVMDLPAITVKIPVEVDKKITKIQKSTNLNDTKESLYLTSFFKKYLLPVYKDMYNLEIKE